MSTSGLSDLSSLRTQSTRTTRPLVNTTRVFADSQCHTEASLTASSTAPSPTDISNAPATLTRPGTRIGDSGTSRWTSTVTVTSGTSGSQNSQWNER